MFQNFGIKALCFLIAVLLWLQAAATTEVEEIQELPVALTGLPDSLTVLASGLPATVSVRVRGNRLQMLAGAIIESRRGHVELSLDGYGPGMHRYEVSVLDVDAPGTALDVVPEVTLDVLVERRITRRVPVEVRPAGLLPENVVLVTGFEVTPELVELVGPESLVSTVQSVQTVPLNLAGRRESFSVRVPLVQPPKGVVFRPVEVQVSAGIEAVAERSFEDVPLTVLREDARSRIELVPPQARVVVRAARSVLDALRTEEISVVVAVPAGIEGVGEVEGEAVVPDGVLSARVEPKTFQVLAEVKGP